MNQGSRFVCLSLIGGWIAILLCSCSGYTPYGRVATREDSITFFNQNRQEFESLRDMMVSEKARILTVYTTGTYRVDDEDGMPPSQDHMRIYVAKLDKLGLPSIGKTFIDPKYPIVDFGVSAVGLAGDGPSVTIFFTKGQPALCHGNPAKISENGWYIASSQ